MRILRQGASFAVIGLAATAVHVMSALAARQWIDASAMQANLVGYGAAVLVSYIGNARFTFGRAILAGGQFTRFLVVSLAGLAVTQAVTWLVVHGMGLPFRVALAVVVVVAPIVSFTLSRIWAFAAPRIPPEGQESRRLDTGDTP